MLVYQRVHQFKSIFRVFHSHLEPHLFWAPWAPWRSWPKRKRSLRYSKAQILRRLSQSLRWDKGWMPKKTRFIWEMMINHWMLMDFGDFYWLSNGYPMLPSFTQFHPNNFVWFMESDRPVTAIFVGLLWLWLGSIWSQNISVHFSLVW